ncbi:MAG: GAF domain-containing protein, partial [Chloroflexota bacterium]|nr:GAF domain-containing protein [Chloroflexota bacterium]
MSTQGLQALTQAVFIVLFLLTVIAFVRKPDRPHLEIAALFGSVGLIVLVQAFTTLTHIAVPSSGLIGGLFLLAQPYLLLRLVAHFRLLPRLQHAIGLVCLVVSWGVLISSSGRALTAAGTILLVLAFAYVEAYASFAFVRAAVNVRGVTQRRLIAVAVGSGALTAVILLAGVTGALRVATEPVRLLSNLLALGSALAYYVGFAPPRWLKRAWLMEEFRVFLERLAGRSVEERLTAALDNLGPAAARAIGGKAAVVALQESDSDRLTIHRDASNEALLERAGLSEIQLSPDSPFLTRAWNEGRAIVADRRDIWGPALRQLASVFGEAELALICPLVAHGTQHGLLVVFFEHRTLFFEDGVELLRTVAEEAARAIEQQLYRTAERAESAKALEHSERRFNW